MNNKFSGAFNRLRYIIGIPSALVLLGFLFTELMVQSLMTMFNNNKIALMVATLFVGAGLVALAWRWSQTFSASGAVGLQGTNGNAKLEKRRGAVIVCGLDSNQPKSSVAKLLQKLPNLEYVAFIGTRETDRENVIYSITHQMLPLAQPNLPASRVRSYQDGNSESISDAHGATETAIRWMLSHNLTPDEIIVDVTAGRRAMGFGANDAARDLLVEVQYLAQEWNHADNKPIDGTEMFKILDTLY